MKEDVDWIRYVLMIRSLLNIYDVERKNLQQLKTLCLMKDSGKKGRLSYQPRTNCSLMSNMLIVKALSWLHAETDFYSQKQ